MILSQRYNLYISSCHENGGIYHCNLNRNGEIEICDKLSLPKVMYTVIKNNSLYAISRSPFSENNDSGIVRIDLCENGSMRTIGEIHSTKGEVGCHLYADNDDLYAVNYISGSVIKLPDTLVIHKGKSVNITRQNAPHTHYINVSPNGKYIYVTDLGTDKIYTYDKNLNCINTTSASLGAGPRHLAFSDDGRYAFCVNELSSTVAMYKISDDKLILVDEKSTLFGGNPESTAAAVRCKGKFVYASNRGDDSVVEFSFDEKGLKQERRYDCGGKSPRDFDIIEDLIICTNELSDNVSVINKNGEILSELKNIANPLCVSYQHTMTLK